MRALIAALLFGAALTVHTMPAGAKTSPLIYVAPTPKPERHHKIESTPRAAHEHYRAPLLGAEYRVYPFVFAPGGK